MSGLAAGLFGGRIAEELVFPYPRLPAVEERRVQELLGKLRPVLERLVDGAVIDQERSIPAELWSELAKLGVFGLPVHVEHGGGGFSSAAEARVLQELAMADLSVAVTILVHSMAARAVTTFGTDAQRAALLPAMSRGELLGAFALTEVGAGSDAAGIRSYAEFDSKIGEYRLTGAKHWVTNGGKAGLIVTFAASTRPGHGQKPRTMALLVEPGVGLTRSEPLTMLGLRGTDVRRVFFEEHTVSADRVLGAPGRGFRIALRVLADARLLLAGIFAGTCRALSDALVLYVRKRRSAGRVIGEYPVVKERIARALALTYGAESAAYLATALHDWLPSDLPMDGAIARLAAADAASQCADLAAHAVLAPSLTSGHRFERTLRDVRTLRALDGAEDVLRQWLAARALKQNAEQISTLPFVQKTFEQVEALRERARQTLGGERATVARAHPALRRESELCATLVRALGRSARHAVERYGPEMHEFQSVQAQLSRAAEALYVLLACLARATAAVAREGEAGARRHVEMTGLVSRLAEEQVHAILSAIDGDRLELERSVAARGYADMGYPFDVF